MNTMKYRSAVIILIVALTGFVIDRWLKLLALHGLTLGPSNGGVRFELLPNPDLAFSIAFPSAWSLAVIPPVLLGFVWLAVRSYRRADLFRAAAALLVDVASMSNYFDRIRYGYVVDYVSLGNWFPVFNLSDVLIVAGLVMLVGRARRVN